MNEVVVAADQSKVPAALEEAYANARTFAEAARARNTRRAYAADCRAWSIWCQSKGLEPWPAHPQIVALHLAELAETLKPSSLDRRLYALVQAERAAGRCLDTRHPAIRDVRAGIRRTKGTRRKQKAPVLIDDVRCMIEALPPSLIGLRDRALLLVGFAGALRRSELVALAFADLAWERDGLVLTLRRSKGDQEGSGHKVALPCGSNLATCPVRAVQDYAEAAGISSGRLFRSISRHGAVGEGMTPEAVALVVKRACRRLGLDPKDYSGHSLRSGFVTTAAINGARERDIARQTRHKSIAVLRGYIRDASLFRDNAAGRLGL